MKPTPNRNAARLSATIAALLLAAVACALVASCARQSGARADSREVRLTQDGVYKSHPRFSPDGKTIAFARRPDDGSSMMGTYVMPVSGGVPERISPDTVGAVPLRWASDGQAIFCVSLDGRHLYRIGLDRSVKRIEGSGALTRFADVAGDGAAQLFVTFNQDNYDVSVRRGAGERVEPLAVTPEWEQSAVFGPGKDQVTTVSAATYQATLTTISVRSLSGGAAKPLPLPEGQKSSPSWSPDGRHLAYAVSSNGQSDLWLYDPTTAKATPAIQDPEDSSAPNWSPDGEWLAFCRVARNSRLFVGEPGDPARHALTNGPANDFGPAGSPDGKWIAFMRRSPPGSEGADVPSLCVMPATGGEATVLDLKGLALPSKGAEVSWSWDSEHIALTAREASTSLDVYRIHRNGSGLRRVSVEAGDELGPTWSPDGKRIAYTRVGGGKTEVAIVPSNGGVAQVVSDERVVSQGGAWTPDGKALAYLGARQDGGFDVWVASTAQGGGRRLLLSHPMLPWPLRWAPDGKHLLLVRGKGSEWHITEYDPESGKERRIATEVMLPTGLGMYLKYLPEGESYRSLLSPAGQIMSDGEQTGDIYMVRASDLYRSRLISRGGLGLGWLASTGWAALY